MRITEGKLRQLIRETLIAEAKINYPGGDSARGVFDYWRHSIPNDFQTVNGRLPTYGEFVKLIEDSAPGFRFQYGANETPDTPLGEVTYRKPGWEFLNSMYTQVVRFVGGDDAKDLEVSRGIERTGLRLRKEANAIMKTKRTERGAEERRRAEEYEATYEPKAPPDAPLGKYAFSPQRQAQVRPPPMERNTPVEVALLRSIRNHFDGQRPLTRQQAQMAMEFIRAGLYPDIFKEPPPGTYYRGMLLTASELRAMGVPDPELGISAGREMEGEFTMVPLGDRFSSSWSFDIDIADRFSLSNYDRTNQRVYSVIFAADSDDNPGKFLDSEGFYNVDLGSDFGEEREVIGLGTITANWVKVVRMS